MRGEGKLKCCGGGEVGSVVRGRKVEVLWGWGSWGWG